MTEKCASREKDKCHSLVQRIVASNYLNKSSRLTEMLLYLTGRVLDEAATDIHELEVGTRVFGRAPHYDTGADNIVRVHASMLRKRLREYFLAEGLHEPIIIDIPRGNYAPAFRPRTEALLHTPALEPYAAEALSGLSESAPVSAFAMPAAPQPAGRWPLWAILAPCGLALVFACLSAFLLVRSSRQQQATIVSPQARKPAMRRFWSQIFRPDQTAQIVLDDASVDFYQVATSQSIPLSEYFDRSYLRAVKSGATTAKLNPDLLENFVLRRQSNFADTSLIWKLAQTAELLKSNADIRFARDLTFSQLKTGNVILLGNPQSNPWIQLFENDLTLRWKTDPVHDILYPQDQLASVPGRDSFRQNAEDGKTHEGYATISFLPNLTGTGNVLIITGTGGTTIAAALDFLSDEHGVDELRARLATKKDEHLPPFEVLLKIEKSISLPRGTTIVTCRALLADGKASTQLAQSGPQTGQD